MTGGPPSAHVRLLLGVSICALPLPAFAAEGEDPPSAASRGEITVYGERQPDVFAGIFPDAELDENDIAAYGFDNVGELIEQVTSEVDRTGEGPVILINGKPASGLADVSDLPTEAVSGIQVYSGQASARLGQSPTRRVVNVVIKPNLEQLTTNAKAGLATAGEGFEGEGEVNLLKLVDGDRRSVVFKARRVDPLLESDRPIFSSPGAIPYDGLGNVVSFPLVGGEIDPALSALAGQRTTLAGIPGSIARPTLADFAALANRPNAGDIGRFRTILPERNVYGLNGNATGRLDERTTLSINVRADWNGIDTLTGLASNLFRVPAGTGFSPFARDVTVARYFGGGLRQDQNVATMAFGTVLNHDAGTWRLSLSNSFSHRIVRTGSERGFDTAGYEARVLAGLANPFAPIAAGDLGAALSDRSRSREDDGSLELFANGPLARLPAGSVNGSLRLGIASDRYRSRTVGAFFSAVDAFKRDEAFARGNVQIPLLSGRGIGSLGFDLDGAVRRLSVIGTLTEYGGTLSWQPVSAVQARVSIEHEEIPPLAEALTDPIVVTEDYRAYDFLRGETVFVPYLTGGNPALPLQKRRTTTVAASLRPFDDMTLTSEFTSVRASGVMATLPPVSAEVQAAFPDRFQRDASGRLVLIDARPVAFARESRRQLRTGVSFNRTFGGAVAGGGGAKASGLSKGRGWRVNLTASDIWTLQSERRARAGLPVIDLLEGGAVGYGGGGNRHLAQLDAGAFHSGIGAQLGAGYRSASRINAGASGVASPNDLRFAARTQVNLRVFANLGPLLPSLPFAKGVRLSAEVENLFDSKQRVVDRTGATPARYQAYLLDPLGRTVSVALRKAF